MTCTVTDEVATLTMTTPSLTGAARIALREAVERVAQDDAVRAVLLTGTGGVFSAGRDLREHTAAVRAEGRDAFDTTADHYGTVVAALATMPKPVVAAVNGTCAGAGLGLALSCDVRLAAAGARFTTAFTGSGLTPDTGLSASLVKVVGAARASELVLLAEPFTADDALGWGLVGRVLPAEELLPAAAALARRLAGGPARAYAIAKHAMRQAWAASLAQVLAAEGRDPAAQGEADDHRAAVEAFLAKQPPRFTGR
ncbi:enoyl-CoA hydratase-related protein [Pseudofrankia sp. DC12]|uniref:enoyl-CoA hydratase/isomerase family protein n=1 Tax=Pseudofrankia sp. DC12 TaxID=683315 RepID=UPI001E338081|nr:enoyl-CoA hydratase-related protein [Pseudofrankia sp. DC12]